MKTFVTSFTAASLKAVWPGLGQDLGFGRGRLAQVCCLGACLFAVIKAGAAVLHSDWRQVQTVELDQAGTIRISLPLETLDAARPRLEDLRLYDEAGRELPYRLDRPSQPPRATQAARDFSVRLDARATVATFETDLTQPVETITLETPARDFLKPATLEGSVDGEGWETLANAQPVFRTADGAARLSLSFAPGQWRRFRLTLEDRRSAPIPLTGARLQAASATPAPAEPFPLKIVDRDESPGQTQITLQAAGAHVTLAGLELETPEPLFTRQVTLSYRDYLENEVRDQTLARGTLFRVALENQPAASNLVFASEVALPTRELILTIQNGDSPPLPVETVRATRRPVYLTFRAAEAGPFHLLSGNSRCAAPQYDLATLPANLAATMLAPRRTSALSPNANFRAVEPLPEITETGTSIDLAKWSMRKRLELAGPGVQQLELDLETLSRCQPAFADLRVVREDRQLPYLLERTAITRAFAPSLTPTNDPKRPTTSLWVIGLPYRTLPLTHFAFETEAPFFKRDVRLTEQRPDERGNPHTVTLATANWVRNLDGKKEKLRLPLSTPPRTDTLRLEIENGDNPPLALTGLRACYRATRVIVKASPGPTAYLYYGNREAAAPRYDIDLVARQLLSAEKSKAALAAAEILLKPGWTETESFQGGAKWFFWIVLGVMIVVLLVVITRLLPKPAP